jgi:hypothetical protein
MTVSNSALLLESRAKLRFSSLVSLSVLCVSALYASPAFSQERDPAAAEVLFREGKKLLNEGKLDQACPKLRESYALDPATGALLATALCYERAGKLASAWAAYTEAASRAKQEGQADREQSARSSADRLEPRLAHLIVEVDAKVDASQVSVHRDGVPLRVVVWGTPIPVDAGAHVITATAPGVAKFERQVTSRDGEEIRVNVSFSRDAGSGVAPVTSDASEPVRADVAAEPSEASGFWTPLRTTGVVIGAFGVGGLALGGLFSMRALSLKDQSERDGCLPDNRCTEEGTSTRLDARSNGDLATIATLAGAVLVTGGVALFVIGAPEDASSVGVLVGPTSASLRGSF